MPVGLPSVGISFCRLKSVKAGEVRGIKPRGYPGAPTKVPFDAMTESCSTHEWASMVDVSSQMATRPAGSESGDFMMKFLRRF